MGAPEIRSRSGSTAGFAACGDLREEVGNKRIEAPEGARLIPLTRGLFAIVDEADYERVAALKWFAKPGRNGVTYAARTDRSCGRRKTVYMHRFIAGVGDGLDVDHFDGSGLNNRRRNLRPCSQGDNARNRRKSGGRMRFKGVEPLQGRFRAHIGLHNRKIHIGYFDTEIEAARAFDRAARRLHGAFANLNFPDETDALHVKENGEESGPWVQASGGVMHR